MLSVCAGLSAVFSRRLAPVALGALAVSLAAASAAGGAGSLVPTLTVTQTTAGLSSTASGGFEPPDVTVAAGPGFVVQLVNLAGRIWRTDAGAPQQVQTFTPATLFQSGGDRLTDPRILYDAASGRWFASISDLDLDSVLVAVSRSADPTAGWNDVASFAAGGCADQPRLGIADGILVLAADIFASCNQGFSPALGGELWIVNKQQLVAGAATVSSTTYGPSRSYESLAPVQSLSATSTEYVVAVDNPSARVVHLLAIDGIPPAAVRVQEIASPPIAPLQQPPRALQPPTGAGTRQPSIETNDNRILDSVWENGKLWFSANSGCVPSGDTALRSCARVVELSTATKSVNWDTDIGQPGAYLFYPAIRPDASGNLVVVYGESGVGELPRLLALARAPDGSFSAPAVIAQSASAHERGRYGDYFGAARDPLHPDVVWVAGEHGVDVPGAHGWSSTVAAVQATPAGDPPPEVRGIAPPGVRALSVAGRAGATIRLSYVALDEGSAVRRRVTVKAKNAVVFSTMTNAGRLNVAQSYSVAWHPVRRLRGTFTWCVQTIAANGTESPQSCAGVILR